MSAQPLEALETSGRCPVLEFGHPQAVATDHPFAEDEQAA
jgi:hypothetical protein